MNLELVFYIVLVLGLGVFAQWIAWRTQIPSIIFLLAFGFGIGFYVDFESVVDKDIIFALVNLGVAIILLEGGLTLRIRELKGSFNSVVLLCTVGAGITWILGTIAIRYFFNMPLNMAFLLGAVFVVTGPTVVSPLLSHIKPSKRVSAIAQWEGILIDPIGAILAVLLFQIVMINEDKATVMDFIKALSYTSFLGCGLGAIASIIVIWLLKNYLIPDFLHSVFILSIALVTFAISNKFATDSGLLTVTIMGIILANQNKVSIRHVVEFKENLRTILLSFLFIVLASRITLEQILSLGWGVIFLLIALIVVIRPVSVLISQLFIKIDMREKIFLSFLAPRGIIAAAVSSIFAIELSEHYSHGNVSDKVSIILSNIEMFAPITFVVIIGTVIFYGFTSPFIARFLKLAVANPQGILFAGSTQWVIEFANAIKEEGFEVLIVDENNFSLSRARMKGIATCRANILSVFVGEELELAGIGHFLSVKRNSAINSLASAEYYHMFGGQNVYQLRTPENIDESARKTVTHHKRRGKLLFDKNVTFDVLSNMSSRGGHVKRTTLSDVFTYEDFIKRYGENTILLCTIKNKTIQLHTDNSPIPTPGTTVLAMVENS